MDWTNVVGAVNDLAQIAAIIVGGVWAYHRFVRQREHRTRADLTHTISTDFVNANTRFLRVTTLVRNIGQVPIEPTSLAVTVRRVSPLTPEMLAQLAGAPGESSSSAQVEFPLLGEHQTDCKSEKILLEPGESHLLNTDFILGGDVRSIEIISELDCGSDAPELAWFTTTLHVFESPASGGSAPAAAPPSPSV